MSPLVQVAFDTLVDEAAGLAARNVACATILAALEQGIESPTGSHLAVWRHLLATDGSSVILHRHELLHEDVAEDAIRVLLDPDFGESAADLALAVLRGGNVRHLIDGDLVTIADRLVTEDKVRGLAFLVERVHEERGLAPELIVGLRDRPAGSDHPTVRIGAVEIAGLAVRLDEGFVNRMISDEAPPVRSAVAELLEKAPPADKPLAVVIARRHLEIERHRTVLSAFHYALGSLVRASRGARPWEPPSGSEN